MSFHNPQRVTEYLIGFDNQRTCRKEDRNLFEMREKPSAPIVARSWRAAVKMAVMPRGCTRKHLISIHTSLDFGNA